MPDIPERLEDLERAAEWLLVRQLSHEAKLKALVQELTRALAHQGLPTEPFLQRLRELEGKNVKELLLELGSGPEDQPPPLPGTRG